MSRLDVENHPAESATNADTSTTIDQAEASLPSPKGFLFTKWSRLFNRKGKAPSAKDQPNSQNVANGASANQTGDPANVQPRKNAFEWITFKREKREPRDGFTTPSFNNLPRPLPVVDVFVSGVRNLIILRVATRVMIFSMAFYLWISVIFSPVWWLIILLIVVCQWRGIKGVGKSNIPTVQQLWSIHRYPQVIWEKVGSRPLLRLHAAPLWWFVYLLISDIPDFEKNFLNALSQQFKSAVPQNNVAGSEREEGDSIAHKNGQQQDENQGNDKLNGAISRPRGFIHIFLGDESLDVPILTPAVNDEVLLKQIRMYYRYLKVRRSLLELFIPRKLDRVQCVQIEGRTEEAGEVKEVLKLGRRLQFFHHPETTPFAVTLSVRINKLDASTTEGLEFVRRIDQRAILGVIMAPSLASLAFIIVWLAVFLRKPDRTTGEIDVQVVTTTAFTVAIYLVTTGALITALVTYWDSNHEKKLSSKTQKDQTETVK